MSSSNLRPPRRSALGRGFTLVESVMVLGVISVLATVAVKTYGDAALKARRAEGVLALGTLVGQQHQFFLECNRYATALGPEESCEQGALRSPSKTAGGLYELATRPTEDGFEVEATAVEGTSQSRDGKCAKLSLRYTGLETLKQPAGCF